MNSGSRFFSGFARHPNRLASVAGLLLGSTVVAKSPTLMDDMKESLQTSPPRSVTSSLPDVKLARKISSSVDTSGLQLRLYQYQTCPFCSKVRTVLDYYGFAYEVVEVNPVARQQIKFTNCRKVPILIFQGLQNKQIQDSPLIVSLLRSWLLHPSESVADVEDYYQPVSLPDPKDPEKRIDQVINRYFLMIGDDVPEKQIELYSKERKWREWCDQELVHVLSPNVYRTWEEALESFQWFSEVGNWEEQFPTWERLMVIYVGAAAMYFIGRRLKKRHNLKEDVRESLYDSCRKLLRAKGSNKFLGGDKPNLADLEAYGMLTAIEGCRAFKDLVAAVKILPWFEAVRKEVESHKGAELLSHRLKLAAKIKK